MATNKMDTEDFKFPDEKEEVSAAADDFEIEIEDDTPPEDRDRQPLPKEMVQELEEDELEEYSEGVKARLKQMKKVWHDERREKERAAREREEAILFANRIQEENKQLKQQLGTGQKLLIDTATKSANAQLSTAKDALTRAYESGDADQITTAQEALTDAKIKLQEYQKFRPTLQARENSVEGNPQQAQYAPQVQPDQKAEVWRQKNTWFGSDEEMTALALGLHERLVRSGVDPRSDDYYRRVDETMRKRFSDYFEDAEPQQTRSATRRSATTVVAPATRSTAPRQVRLTPSQVALAKRLGLTNEAYARELMKLENQNG